MIKKFPEKVLSVFLFFIAMLVFGYYGHINVIGNPMAGMGDTTYFLMTAESLSKDGDFIISKEETDFVRTSKFYPFYLDPGFRLIDPENNRVSIHPVGITLFTLPGYYLGEVWGLVQNIALYNALSLPLLFSLLLIICPGSRLACFLACLIYIFSPPIVILSGSIHIGSLFLPLAITLYWTLLHPSLRNTTKSIILVLLSTALIMLHLRYGPFVAVFWIGTLVLPEFRKRVCWKSFAKAFTFFFVAYFSLISWITSSYPWEALLVANGNNPDSAYSLTTLFYSAIPGMLGDQQVGLLFWFPFLFFCAQGFLHLFKHQRTLFWILFFPVLANTALVSTFGNWSGYWGFTSRMYVPTFLLLFIGLVFSLASWKEYNRLFKFGFIVALILSLPFLYLLWICPHAYLPPSRYPNPVLGILYRLWDFPFPYLFPAFAIEANWAEYLKLFLWLSLTQLFFIGRTRNMSFRLTLGLLLSLILVGASIYWTSTQTLKFRGPDPFLGDDRWNIFPGQNLIEMDEKYNEFGIALFEVGMHNLAFDRWKTGLAMNPEHRGIQENMLKASCESRNIENFVYVAEFKDWCKPGGPEDIKPVCNYIVSCLQPWDQAININKISFANAGVDDLNSEKLIMLEKLIAKIKSQTMQPTPAASQAGD